MLVAFLRKQIITLKFTKIENILNNHNHDKYITTPEFNTLAAGVFNSRLAQANLVAKRDFDNTIKALTVKLMQAVQ